MRKKVLYVILFIMVIGFGYTLFYFNQYSIEDERASIEANLMEWQNKGNEKEIKFDILKVTQIDDTNSYIALFETTDKNIGYTHLLKGWNGKYKIEQSGWGTNIASYQDLKTNKGMYGILVGKNPDLQIDHIIAESAEENFSFTSTVSKDETFLVYEKLPSDLKSTFLPNVTLYDEGQNIIAPLSE